jgi:glycosyltransferase involved in cell wall biosynthesis
MQIVIDGIIYQLQSKGGISRIYNEILPRICNLDESVRINLFTTGLSLQKLPNHPHIRHFPPAIISRNLYPNKIIKPFIEKIIQPQEWISKFVKSNSIWHSTYYTRPEEWRGFEVVTVVDMIHERYPEYYDDEYSKQLKIRKEECILNSETIICISNATRDDLQSFYEVDDAKIHIIYLSHSSVFRIIDDIDMKEKFQYSKPYFIYVGRRKNYKNFIFMLKAYSVWSMKNEISLVVVGNKFDRTEELLLQNFGILDNVHLHENPDDEQLCYLYNNAVALIFPSEYEGFGIPVLEAMACGCLVISSSIPSTREIADDVPIYFDPHDVDSLIHAYDMVLEENSDERIQNGLRLVRGFSWDKTAKETLDVYRLYE